MKKVVLVVVGEGSFTRYVRGPGGRPVRTHAAEVPEDEWLAVVSGRKHMAPPMAEFVESFRRAIATEAFRVAPDPGVPSPQAPKGVA